MAASIHVRFTAGMPLILVMIIDSKAFEFEWNSGGFCPHSSGQKDHIPKNLTEAFTPGHWHSLIFKKALSMARSFYARRASELATHDHLKWFVRCQRKPHDLQFIGESKNRQTKRKKYFLPRAALHRPPPPHPIRLIVFEADTFDQLAEARVFHLDGIGKLLRR